MGMIFAIIPLLFYVGMIGGIIYTVITILTRMKERNEYLKGIYDELKKMNNIPKETVQKVEEQSDEEKS